MRRVLSLWRRSDGIDALVTRSYDTLSGGYDAVWTAHMRPQTQWLLDQLPLGQGGRIADLACGSGFATGFMAQRCPGEIIGVDRSAGMLEQARRHYGQRCRFIQDDILNWLGHQPSASFDMITCCWALGYSRPWQVLGQIRRVLRPGGRVAIIDNTLFSLREVLYCSMLAFMEKPDALTQVMRLHFLTGRRQLVCWLRARGLRVTISRSGECRYEVPDAQAAIARLRATGAAAGFEYACRPEDEAFIFRRFGAILEAKYRRNGVIPLIHRYAAAVGVKP